MEEQVKDILLKFWPGINILDFETPICDLLVEVQDTSLKFSVEVKIKSSLTEQVLSDFYNQVGLAIYRQGAPNIPVILALYDDQLGSVELGIAVSWRINSPVVDKNMKFIELNQDTADAILDNIKASDSVIRMLSDTNCKVVKRINFRIPFDKLKIACHIIYLRDFSPAYKMNCRKTQNKQEEMNRFLYGIPQDEYPNDPMDEMILDAIKNKYVDAERRSSLLLFSTELRDLKTELSSMLRFDCNILIEPSVSQTLLPYFDGIKIVSLRLDTFMDFTIGEIAPETMFYGFAQVQSVADYLSLGNLVKTVKRSKAII